MIEKIKNILKEISDIQINLKSQAAREYLAKKIENEINKK